MASRSLGGKQTSYLGIKQNVTKFTLFTYISLNFVNVVVISGFYSVSDISERTCQKQYCVCASKISPVSVKK